MNSKMRTDSQLSTTKLKKQNKNKNELRKQLEQEQNHRNRDYMEGCQWEWGGVRMEEKVQEIRSINSRYKINRERMRIV